MGATHSTPASPPTPDGRSLLERIVDPAGVLSATPTHPALVRQLNANSACTSESASPRAPSSSRAAAPCDSHISLSIEDSGAEHLDTVDLHDDAELESEQRGVVGEGVSVEEESYVDTAMSLIAPRPVVAMLASPAVSGEMQFVDESRRRQAARDSRSSSTSRMTV